MRLRTLRGRLAAAMLFILVISIAVSSLVDNAESPQSPPATDEPYQDALVLAGFCLPALILIWLISSWSLHPLAWVSQQARNVRPGDTASRLSSADLPAEIVPMVEAVNGALDRMAEAFAAERRFTENAAHELRTPLSVLSLRLQRARHSSAGASAIDWTAIDSDLDQLNRLVNQMLYLARQENAGRSTADLQKSDVNLSRIVREACAVILPVVEHRGRVLSVEIPEGLYISGDADALKDVMQNLLENAVLHGQGMITVRASTNPECGHVELCVIDEGAGFDPAEIEAVFSRFHKGDHSTGTGLGLAIVREVVRNHGGSVSAHPRPPGRVDVILPLTN